MGFDPARTEDDVPIGAVLREGETLDAIGEGRVRLIQRRDGYRFNLDAVLLAGFALGGLDARRPRRVVDLGTGCGVVALLVSSWRPGWSVTGVERQANLADCAVRSAALGGGLVRIVHSDWSLLTRPGEEERADLVLCNPPYFEPNEVRAPEDPECAAARVALHGGLVDAAKAARRIGTDRVSLRLVFPAARLPRLFTALAEAKLAVARVRPVHAHADDEAYAVLVEATAGFSGAMRLEPPLVVHGELERFTPEVRRLLSRAGPEDAPPA